MLIRDYFLFLVLIFCNISAADAMRCGDTLVYEGDSKFDVLDKCGDPLDKQTYEQSTPLYNDAGYRVGTSSGTIDVWTYQKSSVEFQYVLTFDEGILKKISANRNP